MITKITMISRSGDSEINYKDLVEWRDKFKVALAPEFPGAEINIKLSSESGISSVLIEHDGTCYVDEEKERDFIFMLSNKVWDSIC